MQLNNDKINNLINKNEIVIIANNKIYQITKFLEIQKRVKHFQRWQCYKRINACQDLIVVVTAAIMTIIKAK